MATTITPVPGSATPYSKQYLLSGDGAEGIRSLSDLATDLAAGPLKRTLLGPGPALPTGTADFNIDQARGNEIRIYDVAAVPSDAAVTKGGTRRIRWVANGLSCTLQAASTLTIEIRLNHSTQA